MSTTAISRLVDLTRDTNNDVKTAAIYALGESGYKTTATISRLTDLTRDINNDVKIAAIKALGRILRPDTATH
ncbi:TPA: HEAT repeat domain-containing protein [Proteus mirabilis]|uniref:HEAT repeat domain-containing protein n=1 Tax=Proteus mirabilis TaxID=584 RepID=A0AAN4CCU1_PROMI|nr:MULTISPECIES: HEAT repeat domain-containing protein [Proteus]EKU8115393.1 HEAT repeat domain-containing protein [Proteus mirabilis]EKW9777294.1 HEAT repeat domain-containing protein [Proteus mirabilis]EKX9510617.1 HEAT repeat domain-containing protein [Proteus mirabilis]ELA7706765.1 HEAT repeat domain-containing protein [Proteus mirabilis]EMB2317762.1 HEAT repeat domain-containing protein [Proteus mirabilis]